MKKHHTLAVKATNRFDNREIYKELSNAKHREEIIFTKGATESINLIASSYGEKILNKGDEILTTELEHHSNYVLGIFRKKGVKIQFAPVTTDEKL